MFENNVPVPNIVWVKILIQELLITQALYKRCLEHIYDIGLLITTQQRNMLVSESCDVDAV